MRHRSASPTVLLAIAVLIASATPAAASWSPTTVVLGAPGGWTRFAAYGTGNDIVTRDCASGGVTSVTTALTNNYLTGATITCTPFARDGGGIDLVMAGATTTPPSLGGSGSGGGTATCPVGDVVVGVRPYVGDVIGGFTLLCQGLDDHQPSGTPTETPVVGGGVATPDPDPMVCSAGEVVTGLNAEFAYYDMVNGTFASFGMQCSKIEASGSSFAVDGELNGTGSGVIDPTGTLQVVSRKIPAGTTRTNALVLANEGDGWDTLRVQAEGSQGPFKVGYRSGGQVTADVVSGDFGKGVGSGATATVAMRVEVKAAAKRGTKRTWTFAVTSSGVGGSVTDVLVLTLIAR